MILDVGCGNNPQGDVNCDIVKQDTSTPFILCDSQHLPFRPETFTTVHSSHVIEHVNDPVLMMEELLRVSNKHVTVKTPHLFSYSARGLPFLNKLTGFTYHIHTWTSNYWKKLLSNYNFTIKIKPRLKPQFWWIPFKTINMIIEVEK